MLRIERFIKKHRNIVHGRKALNKQLPPKYRRPTFDWDLFSKHPKKDADKLQEYMDKFVGWDRFYMESKPITGRKDKLYRVVDRLTGGEVADFMKTPRAKNLYVVISGIRYETLERAKRVYKKILSDPKYQHRWAKARYDLQTIEEFERELKKGKVNKNKIPSVFKLIEI